jgi:SAM-dependent methyltransferase
MTGRRSLGTALGALAALALIAAGPAAAAEQRPAAVAAPVPRKPDVRYEPSPHRVVRAMLALAQVGPQDVVYDLGSGDGRIPIAAARDFGARAVGIDIDPKLIARARQNAGRAGVSDRVVFRNEDLFAADFSEATVVTLFLYPDLNLKLRPKLLATLRPGARVVSHMHSMGEWRPQASRRVQGRDIYLWIIPRPGDSGRPPG